MADLEFAQAVEAPAGASTIALSEEKEKEFTRIVRSLQEYTGGEIIRKVLADGEVVRAYWGSAITGRPHIAYCVPFMKIADFLTAGVHVKVLLADRLHGFLDANKSTIDVLSWRTKYYEKLFKSVFTVLGVPIDKLEFVLGTSYQLKADYTMDVYKLHNLATVNAAAHAGAEVVKASESPLVGTLLYPGLQTLDEQYLDVHFQFGGVDQRKIFMYAAHFLPRMGYAKRAHLMNPMVPGLSGGKMSSSDPKSKIDFLDSPAEIKAKLKAALCTPGEVEGNGVLAFVKAVLIPVQELQHELALARGEKHAPRDGSALNFVKPDAPADAVFSITRPEKFGGDIHFKNYEELEAAYAKEEIHPGDLKAGVTDALIKLLEPIGKMFWVDEEWKEAERMGYPGASVQGAPTAEAAVPLKAEAKKAAKSKADHRSAPPTEEERAALRAKKEQEKLAKQQAKDAASASGSGANALTATSMPKLKLLAKGKVRDIYEIPGEADKLLFVATDRMSAFDVIMNNGIPQKGVTLTTLSLFWFHNLSHILPHHVLAPSVSGSSPACLQNPRAAWSEFPRSLDEYRDQLEGRSMIVRKCAVVKIEAIVRGYITGSAWSEYQKSGTVHTIPMPKGLVESQKLPKPIFTPSTKAEQGEHDENIHPDKVKDICGPELAAQIEEVAIRLYSEAANYALARGLILADTKFEFGLLDTPNGKQLILIDEVLTPDSSRYWSAADYTPGKPQASFDKQYLRDWLIREGLKAKPDVTLPPDVVAETKRKYEEARDWIMGSEKGTHGRKDIKAAEGTTLQTDQVADAIESEARKI